MTGTVHLVLLGTSVATAFVRGPCVLVSPPRPNTHRYASLCEHHQRYRRDQCNVSQP